MQNRRPIKARDLEISKWMAYILANYKISPNCISVFSVVFSAMASILMLWKVNIETFVFIVACLLLRLICNMLDGMVAIEYGKKSVSGILYNEVPDRISDICIFFSAGFITGRTQDMILGSLIACIAVFTAYIRILGETLGQKHIFKGYGQKQHRVFLLIATIMAYVVFLHPIIMTIGLSVILVASLQTCIVRLYIINRMIEE